MKEKKFLLIEDDQDHAELIADVLSEDNVEGIKVDVILMKDGQEAIDFFQSKMQSQITLVILDLNLPKVDGMDVLKYIKKNSKHCSVPVIILSTSSNQKTIDEAYKNGVNGYITKPSSYDDLVEKVQILKNYG
jgi:DNA-binding response OmpR family regulator